MMVNDELERMGKETIVFQTFLEGIEESHKIPQSRYPVSESRIEPDTSRMRNRIAIHCTAKFGSHFVIVSSGQRLIIVHY
jgi:hypothetical protein